MIAVQEQALLNTVSVSLPYPTLCLVTDMEKVGKDRLLKVIDESVQGGVNLVQVREKRLTEETLKNLVLDVVDVVDGRAFFGCKFQLGGKSIAGSGFSTFARVGIGTCA